MRVRIHYRDDSVRELYQAAGIKTNGSAGFDLVAVEDVTFERLAEFRFIDLGVIIQVPDGCHSLLLPRSSTFMRYKILQANSVGLIDSDYCGSEDWWKMPAVYLGEGEGIIPRGTRICQFLLNQTLPIKELEEFHPESNSRGGFGSTGA
ncbi:deoxyuridine 5'-triphosphate nucleotidohydrolase [bacterium]|jgi:dUTP pyrophosphatase|nr:deoxyuridine 5'-triphosphate nucleotidohydrolase [bacterium]